MKAPSRILAAVDLSPATAEVLDAALVSARAFHASLDLLSVREPLAYPTTGGAVPVAGEEQLAHDFIDDALARLADQVNHAGVVCLSSRLDGPVARTIIEHARRSNIDLVVIGARGRGALTHALLGSVAERVVHRATCPVLVVPISVAR